MRSNYQGKISYQSLLYLIIGISCITALVYVTFPDFNQCVGYGIGYGYGYGYGYGILPPHCAVGARIFDTAAPSVGASPSEGTLLIGMQDWYQIMKQTEFYYNVTDITTEQQTASESLWIPYGARIVEATFMIQANDSTNVNVSIDGQSKVISVDTTPKKVDFTSELSALSDCAENTFHFCVHDFTIANPSTANIEIYNLSIFYEYASGLKAPDVSIDPDDPAVQAVLYPRTIQQFADGSNICSLTFTGGDKQVCPNGKNISIPKDSLVYDLTFYFDASGVSNLAVDIGNDGTIDWSDSLGSAEVSINMQPYLDNCDVYGIGVEGKMCGIPLAVTSDTAGTLDISIDIDYQNIPVLYRGCEVLSTWDGRQVWTLLNLNRNYTSGSIVGTCRYLGVDLPPLVRATDLALNTNRTAPAVDNTPPVTAIALWGTKGNDPWWVSDVAVTLTATDDGAVAETVYCLSPNDCSNPPVNYYSYIASGPFTIPDEGPTTVYYRSADYAGNVETPIKSTTIYIDKTPPITYVNVSGIEGDRGWYRSDVTVTLDARDNVSDVAVTYYLVEGEQWRDYADTGPFTVSAEGETTIYYYSINRAGLSENIKETKMKIDRLSPYAEYNITGEVGENDWFISPVEVVIKANDTTSGIKEICHDIYGVVVCETKNITAPVIEEPYGP